MAGMAAAVLLLRRKDFDCIREKNGVKNGDEEKYSFGFVFDLCKDRFIHLWRRICNDSDDGKELRGD